MSNDNNQVNWKAHSVGLIMLTISLSTTVLSGIYASNMNDQLKAAENTVFEQEQLNFQSAEQKKTYDQYIKRYLPLVEKGVVGNTQRLQWLETLKGTSEKLALPKLEYTVEKTLISSEPVDFYTHPSSQFEATPMKLDMKIMHEGDFFNLFKELRNKANGIFSVEYCYLKVIQSELGSPSKLEQDLFQGLNGECRLSWYTFLPLNEQQGNNVEDPYAI